MGNHKDSKNAVATPSQRPGTRLQRRTCDHDVVNQHSLRLCWHTSHPDLRPPATKALCPSPGGVSDAAENVADDGTPPRQRTENREAGRSSRESTSNQFRWPKPAKEESSR